MFVRLITYLIPKMSGWVHIKWHGVAGPSKDFSPSLKPHLLLLLLLLLLGGWIHSHYWPSNHFHSTCLSTTPGRGCIIHVLWEIKDLPPTSPPLCPCATSMGKQTSRYSCIACVACMLLNKDFLSWMKTLPNYHIRMNETQGQKETTFCYHISHKIPSETWDEV